MQAVEAAPEGVRSLLLANIVLIGGNCKIPGFHERLSHHLLFSADEIERKKFGQWLLRITLFDSSRLQSTFPFSIVVNSSPITCAWEGGSTLASDKKLYASKVVTRKEYMEHGSNLCSTRFDTPKSLQEGTLLNKDLIDEDMY
jgi:actin-related protein 6